MNNQTVAVFVFRSPDLADHALQRLFAILDRGFERSAGFEIWISASCIDPNLASRVCMNYGGVPR